MEQFTKQAQGELTGISPQMTEFFPQELDVSGVRA